MTLAMLFENISCQIDGDPATTITGLSYDSRRTSRGDAYFALPGLLTDGRRFASDAVAAGAAAVVVESPLDSPPSVPVVQVEDCRQAMALASSKFYGHPSRSLTLIGVTGTNGKTSAAHILRSIMAAAGQPAGLLGTIHHAIGDQTEKATLTTPEAPDINHLLRSMVKAGMKAAVMEVSSHGLALNRVEGLDFDVAVFTNFSQDHLDFHKSEAAYFDAKALLFQNLKPSGHAILNIDDRASETLRHKTAATALTYALRNPDADVTPLSWDECFDGLSAQIRTPAGNLELSSPLLGEFNLSNILAAVAAACALGLRGDAITKGVRSLNGVPGRAERVPTNRDFTVLIDYAHTPNALKSILKTARTLRSRLPSDRRGRIICIFGCGGERDRTKRPLMGRVAADLADYLIITSDNPRREEPETIIAAIAEGIKIKDNVISLTDRAQAIRQGLTKAKANDIVLICGKGHETYQDIGGQKLPFSDRAVIEEFLRAKA